MPFGQMPVLEYKGHKLAQTHAIHRFLASQFNMMGKDAWENAELDMLADRSFDLLEKSFPAFFEKDPAKKVS